MVSSPKRSASMVILSKSVILSGFVPIIARIVEVADQFPNVDFQCTRKMPFRTGLVAVQTAGPAR